MAKSRSPKSEQYPAVLPMLNAVCPGWRSEYRFAGPRRWRFDMAHPDHRIAIEINGGIWTGGRHARGSGLVKEYEKMRAAAVLGWRVLPITPQELHLLPSLVASAIAYEGAAP